ncbi:sugar-binding protein [Virgibacillus sp. SK37]|uniref:sugar-binding protein n=1 Tax=Virgibacillus sp. SK37 TaxID=403957 RepID=UPI0004D0BFDB|nr:sugar-binding protein [Virgibacillus sp. SK37]AIF44578.1 LacI family transcriptional regulator [Virgibacillus sp. SK37]
MRVSTKLFIYCISILLFVGSISAMLFFGYKTFYIVPDTSKAENYSYHFALVAEETENNYWRLVEKGAKRAAAEKDIYLEYIAPSKADNDQLLKLFDRMIAAKVDGIIVQGIEGERFVDLVHKGVERNIPVITIDTDVPSERKAYVGTDNFYAGQLAGRYIIENTKGEQHVGVIVGRFEAINQQERLAGFKDAIKAHPRIQIAKIKESNITEIGATQATYVMMKQHPEINALLGLSALDGLGMVEGIQQIFPTKDVLITSFDILPETMKLIREGKIDATIAQYPEEMGSMAVDVLIDLQNRDLVDNKIYTKTEIIEKADLQVKPEVAR